MKKIVLILICIFTFSLIGCNRKVNNTSAASHKKVKLDYPIHLSNKVLDNTSDITEDNNFIYYADKNGINKVDKKGGKSKLILKKKDINQLVLLKEKIYFSTADEKNFQIFSVDKSGDKCLKIVDGKNITYANLFRYFVVQDNNIYFDTAMSVYLFDMSSGKLKLLNNDVYQFEINKGYMYYIDHGQKTFTIYKENINDMNSQIILGKGISKPNKDIYYSFAFIGSDLYFLKRIPRSSYGNCATALYAYKNGNEVLIRKNDNEGIDEEMVEYKEELYFVTDDSSNKDTLWKYSNKDNTMSKVACIESSKLDSYFIRHTVKIVNGYLYYLTKNYKLRCIKLN